jgi:SAM-dependent methyltransferase/uncharacterized protein YbaR (Trm112 family)
VRRRHFEALRPVCPVCRNVETGAASAVRLAGVLREEQEVVLEGTLCCGNDACQREYPIIDGIPLLIPAIRTYVSENLLPIFARADLSATTESILGDCCGPGSALDGIRQRLSSYAWDHYAAFDPGETTADPAPGSVVRLLDTLLGVAGDWPGGPILDAGCSVGGVALELAERFDALVLGVDLNFAMLRLAAEVLRTGKVRYPRRRVGLVYERREFPVPLGRPENVDFWACDVTALPLPEGSLAAVVSLNVLDSVNSPVEHLRSLARVLAPGGKALLGCPYDWAPSATPLEGWLGGHSQRGPDGGTSEPVLRRLLTPGAHPWSVAGLELRAECEAVPWSVRLHERSTVSYRVHGVVAEKVRPV